MADTELQLLKLDMEYTKKAVAKLETKMDAGFASATTELAGLRDQFDKWTDRQETLFVEMGAKSALQISNLIDSFDKKLESKPNKTESWAESAIKWLLITVGTLIVGYAFKVIFIKS